MKKVSKQEFINLFPPTSSEGILGVVESWAPTHMVCYEGEHGMRLAIPVGAQNTRKNLAHAEHPVFCEIGGDPHKPIAYWEVADGP